ncbi:hypothetical protein D3C85_15280 [compost metagenome]
MTIIDIIRSELLTVLENNPSKNIAYHNNFHMIKVAEIAAELWKNDYSYLEIGDAWGEIALLISAMLHDWGHSGGHETDDVNIRVACTEAEIFISGSLVSWPEVRTIITEAIQCTQFPFVRPPKNKVERVLRDADLLYTAIYGDPAVVIEHLRSEVEVSQGRSITRREMLRGQEDFLKSAVMFTPHGEKLWTEHAYLFFQSMCDYVNRLEPPVIDTCNLGHKFAKLHDHPLKDGAPRCPHCMAMGLDSIRSQKEMQLKSILSFIDEGCDELLIRRIWERAMRVGHNAER